jgi:hypothetical protein
LEALEGESLWVGMFEATQPCCWAQNGMGLGSDGDLSLGEEDSMSKGASSQTQKESPRGETDKRKWGTCEKV